MSFLASQSFTSPFSKKNVAKNLADLRQKMKERQIGAYLIPSEDDFFSEYVPEARQYLAYLSAFTGSWGLLCVFEDSAYLYVDGRYRLQASQQTDSDYITPICLSDLSLEKHWQETFSENIIIHYPDDCFDVKTITRYQSYLIPLQGQLKQCSPINIQIPLNTSSSSIVTHHPITIAGESYTSKKERLLTILKGQQADHLLITLPESVCWLLNVRGNDCPHTPFVLSRAILSKEGILHWFITPEKLPTDVLIHLDTQTILHDPKDFYDFIADLPTSHIWCDDRYLSQKLNITLVQKAHTLIKNSDPILGMKAIKNQTEQEAIKQAHVIDAVAMIKFIHWFYDTKQPLTEIDCVKQLESYRKEHPDFKDTSFDTISGSAGNGAIIHYRVLEETNRTLQEGDLFLCDSGGQYPYGTTDITRVFVKGIPSPLAKKRYTQVLKAHLALAHALFPENTSGACLDGITRSSLWQSGIDYDHGTGHGVGQYLSVHEGPQSISGRSIGGLKEGMILSNEPGYYQTDDFGIRIENLEVVVKKGIPVGGNRHMCGFETLTLVPYDPYLMNETLLSPHEKQQINHYHQRIIDKVMPLLPSTTQNFLKTYIKQI